VLAGFVVVEDSGSFAGGEAETCDEFVAVLFEVLDGLGHVDEVGPGALAGDHRAGGEDDDEDESEVPCARQ
jgi:hypothetical protein